MIVRAGAGVAIVGSGVLTASDDMGWSPCDATGGPSHVALVIPSQRARI